MTTDDSRSTTGVWLAASALLLIVALALHPPPPAEIAAFSELIAAEGDTWVLAHWLAAAALASFVVTAMLGLTAGSGTGLGRSAWALVAVGALATLVTAVAEATVIADAAAANDMATFGAWQPFASGMSMGFALMALGFSGIAWSQTRVPDPAVPRWSARAATMVGIVSGLAWTATMGLGITRAGPVWLLSSFVVTAWLVWFGVGLVRAAPTTRPEASHA